MYKADTLLECNFKKFTINSENNPYFARFVFYLFIYFPLLEASVSKMLHVFLYQIDLLLLVLPAQKILLKMQKAAHL